MTFAAFLEKTIPKKPFCWTFPISKCWWTMKLHAWKWVGTWDKLHLAKNVIPNPTWYSTTSSRYYSLYLTPINCNEFCLPCCKLQYPSSQEYGAAQSEQVWVAKLTCWKKHITPEDISLAKSWSLNFHDKYICVRIIILLRMNNCLNINSPKGWKDKGEYSYHGSRSNGVILFLHTYFS